MLAENRKALQARLKYVVIEHVPVSQAPYRVTRKRTGCTEGAFLTQDDAEAFVLKMDLAVISKKPTRGRRRY